MKVFARLFNYPNCQVLVTIETAMDDYGEKEIYDSNGDNMYALQYRTVSRSVSTITTTATMDEGIDPYDQIQLVTEEMIEIFLAQFGDFLIEIPDEEQEED